MEEAANLLCPFQNYPILRHLSRLLYKTLHLIFLNYYCSFCITYPVLIRFLICSFTEIQ